jgi:hypothetical protein
MLTIGEGLEDRVSGKAEIKEVQEVPGVGYGERAQEYLPSG